jgi:Flp pilus assembly protein TadG
MHPALLRLWTSRRGNAATEFALVLPVIVFMFAAIVEFGRIFQVYNATNLLASQYAIALAQCSSAQVTTCQTDLAEAATNIAPQLTGTLTLNMFTVTNTSGTLTYTNPYPSGATPTSAQTTAAKNVVIIYGQTGVLVTATYTHTLIFITLLTPYLSKYLTPSYTVVQANS